MARRLSNLSEYNWNPRETALVLVDFKEAAYCERGIGCVAVAGFMTDVCNYVTTAAVCNLGCGIRETVKERPPRLGIDLACNIP